MPFYQRRGDVPRKRHIVFRDNGTLLTEEVMGLEGFTGNESILYHLQSPCRVKELGAFTPFYSSYAGTKAPVEHFTRAAAKEFGERGISVTAIGPGPMDTPFFYGQESTDAQAYHKGAAALSTFSKTGLTDIEDIVPHIRFLVSDGWWPGC